MKIYDKYFHFRDFNVQSLDQKQFYNENHENPLYYCYSSGGCSLNDSNYIQYVFGTILRKSKINILFFCDFNVHFLDQKSFCDEKKQKTIYSLF